MANYSYFSGGGSGISPLPPNFAQLATAGPAAIAQGMKEASQAIGDALKEKQKAAKLKKKEASSSVNFIKGHIAAGTKYKSLLGLDADDLDNMSSDEQIELGAQVMAERQASMDATAQQGQELRNNQLQQSMSMALQNNARGQQTRDALGNMIQGYSGPLQEGETRNAFNMGSALSQNPGADPMALAQLYGTFGKDARESEMHDAKMGAMRRAANAPTAGTLFTDKRFPGFIGQHHGDGRVSTVRGATPEQTELEKAKTIEAQAKADIFKSIANKTKGGVNPDNLSGLNNMQKDKVKRLQNDLQEARDNLEMIKKLETEQVPFVNYDDGIINYDKSKDQDSASAYLSFGEMSRSKAKIDETKKIRDLEKQIEEITGQQRANEVVDRIINQELDPNDRAGIYK
jgi:hypothetical protein